jgi:hypothetical protein
LELFELPNLVHLQSDILLFPSVEGLLGNSYPPDQFSEWNPCFCLFQNCYDLLDSESLLFHGKSPFPCGLDFAGNSLSKWIKNTGAAHYCTYDFFDQCPHRMACAKCSFYMPKGSTMAALLEGKNNLLRMRQEIPLSDAELAALDDGVSALESLLSRLTDVPTPAGPTPLQLRDTPLIQIEAAD